MFSRIFPSTFFVIVYFHASIFICVDIVMASLCNGMLDILLDFHDVCPWNFIGLSSVFIFLSCILRPAFASFLSSAQSTDYWGDMGEFSGMGRAGAVY